MAAEDFAERILNGDATTYEAETWPDYPRGKGSFTDEELTGFAADVSDCDDGRSDDLTEFPKKFKRAVRDWALSRQRITALKKDLNTVPLTTFIVAYKRAMGPTRQYSDYLLDLIGSRELSSLPELIYIRKCNVTDQGAGSAVLVANRTGMASSRCLHRARLRPRWFAGHEVSVHLLARRVPHSSRERGLDEFCPGAVGQGTSESRATGGTRETVSQ